MDSGNPGLSVLVTVRKQDEESTREASKQHISKASAFAPASRFLTCLSSYPKCCLQDKINLFLHKFHLVMFHHKDRTLTNIL